MKLLFVVGTMGGGGAERVISLVSNNLADKEDITILTLAESECCYRLSDKIKIDSLTRSKTPIIRRLKIFSDIRKKITEISPDCIIVFVDQIIMQTAVALSFYKHNFKVIFAERNDPLADPSSKLLRGIRNLLYKKADAYVFQTKKQEVYFKKIIAGKQSVIISNPVKDELPVYTGCDSKTFIAAGRLTAQKNYKLMIDAFSLVVRKYEGYHLKIYGQGPEEKELLEYINKKQLSSNISLLPFEKAIHEKMSKAKGYLMSSDFEGVSNSMLEALKIGVPVVCTDYPSGGAAEYIDDSRGYLIPCGDVNRFAEAICSIIEDPEEALSKGENAAKYMSNFSQTDIINTWMNYIESVCKMELKL